MAHKHMMWVDWLAIIFLITGGLVWLVFAIARMFFSRAYLLVDSLLGVGFANVVYLIVGVSALYSIVSLYKLGK
jgi:uncharacterized membrane protein YuzA (DUF378 family)